MKTLEIKANKRTGVGKNHSAKLRKEKRVPCVLYGHGEENLHIEALAGDLRHLVFTPHTFFVKLDIEGEVQDAIMQDLQFHPVTDEVLHIDFLRISKDKPVKVQIPVRTLGTAEGVVEGGVLTIITRKLTVKALPEHMPEELEVDISPLQIGDSMKIGELKFENLELLDPRDAVVCTVQTTRAARSAAGMLLPEDEEELAEGEEAVEGEAEGEEKKSEK